MKLIAIKKTAYPSGVEVWDVCTADGQWYEGGSYTEYVSKKEAENVIDGLIGGIK